MTENPQRESRSRRYQHSESNDAQHRWLVSYADLMTLLLALFIVLYAAVDNKRAARIASAVGVQFGEGASSVASAGVLPGGDSLVTEKRSVEKAFAENENLRNRAKVSITERGIVISLTEAGFFAPADDSLREDAISLLKALSDSLRDSPAAIRLEGHTDSLRISNNRFRSNWELSAARATSVLFRLGENGIPAERMSVAGFADSRPIADNATAEGRAANRRVDLVILADGK
jgi:chemotaxis protein MotB